MASGGVSVVVRMSRTAVQDMVTDPASPAMRDLLRRGNAVRNAALDNIRSMGIGTKVGTGQLAGSLVVEAIMVDGQPAIRIGSRLPYAIYVHEGHGVILPRNGRFLAWPNPRGPGYIFARRVGPYPAKPFLREALQAAAY